MDRQLHSVDMPATWSKRLCLVLVVIHVGLLAWSAYRHSPTKDEYGHLPAGLVIWRFGDFSVYRVNPPLVKAVAAIPILFVEHKEDWSFDFRDARRRIEWRLGRDFFVANGSRSMWLLTLARWACIPISLIGLLVCWQWGRELISERAGITAATLWCFSPNIIGHGSLITPDIAATSMGLLAAWRFSRWLQAGQWPNAILAGLALGLALLTKTYWVILLIVWPLILIGSFIGSVRTRNKNRELIQIVAVLTIGLYVLNSGYGFKGFGTPLSEFEFYSFPLAGESLLPEENLPKNRFQETWLSRLPVPLPKSFVSGIDLQKVDFEQERWNYLLGETKLSGGWWYFYIVGLFVKVPLGTWLLLGLGLITICRNQTHRSTVFSLMPLLVSVTCLFALASSQTSMNRHVRYVFPCLPAIYLLGSIAVSYFPRMTLLAAGMTIVSSLSVFPHSMSFFNYAIGGPEYGDQYLVDSNLDWGQDMIFVQEWTEANPDKRPVSISWLGFLPLEIMGVDAKTASSRALSPGFYIVSRHLLRDPRGGFGKFLKLTPVDRVGYSFNVYYGSDVQPRPNMNNRDDFKAIE